MTTRRMATAEIIPGLYQRANFLSWTYKQKQDFLHEHGISVVVNLWNKVDPDLSGQVLYICWPIRGNKLPDGARALILMVAALIKRGETVLVHCEAGVNRSAWFCAEVVSQLNGLSLKDALAFVQEKQPRAKVNMGLKDEDLGEGEDE